MSIWVRKNSHGKVVEKTTINPNGRFHPSIVWEQIDNPPTIASQVMTVKNKNTLKSDFILSLEEVQYDEDGNPIIEEVVEAEPEANTAPEATANTA